jgi:uncharacterized coiled-coil protein SlyX
MNIEDRIAELEHRTAELESRVSSLETSLALMSSQLDQFGSYKDRPQNELKLMKEQIGLMVSTCEILVKDAINQADIQRAKSVLRRLRNNQTRIAKALAA